MQLALVAEITVVISVLLQFAAGVLALRLIPISGKKVAWTLVALALFGMGLRRSISLARIFYSGTATPLDLEYELLGLLVSALMCAGVYGIRPIFEAIRGTTAKLRRSEERYRAFIDNTLEGIIVVDSSSGTIIEANEHFQKLTGYKGGELLGMNVCTFAPGREEAMRMNLARVAEGGRASFGERIYSKKDGSELAAEVSAVALEGERGQVAYIVVHDVTERKREAQVREKMIAELEDAMAKVKTLSGLLPVCATCKKIRNDEGYWTQMEKYLSQHADVVFTHGICPECMEKALEELDRETL